MSKISAENLYTIASVCTIGGFYISIAMMITAYSLRTKKLVLSNKLKKISIYMIFVSLGLYIVWGIIRAISTSPYF